MKDKRSFIFGSVLLLLFIYFFLIQNGIFTGGISIETKNEIDLAYNKQKDNLKLQLSDIYQELANLKNEAKNAIKTKDEGELTNANEKLEATIQDLTKKLETLQANDKDYKQIEQDIEDLYNMKVDIMRDLNDILKETTTTD